MNAVVPLPGVVRNLMQAAHVLETYAAKRTFYKNLAAPKTTVTCNHRLSDQPLCIQELFKSIVPMG